MEKKFREAIDRIKAASGKYKFLLAVSAGVDSVVMASLFNRIEADFKIVHCNFQLRGDESNADERFVNELAENLGVECLVKAFHTEVYATEKGVSIQMAARDLRYNWFRKLAIEQNALIVTAHHANDVAETMLFNLAKGTGLAGLHGIIETDGTVVRPMLQIERKEIIEYARANGIEWREDSSNFSDKYARNLVRNKIIPEFEKINPSFVSAMNRTAARATEIEEFVDHALQRYNILHEYDDRIEIDKLILENLPGRVSVIYHLIRRFGFNYSQTRDIADSLASTGAVFYTGKWQLNIDRKHLIVKQLESTETKEILIDDRSGSITILNQQFELQIVPANNYEIKPDGNIAALDMEKLKFPLALRPYREGESFVPLGMTGRKKISDFLIDKKVPVIMKKEQLVLISEGEIVWLAGYRISERYKITDKTDMVVEIQKKS